MSARSNPAGRSDPAKRSLKDRASEVEASAARVIKGRGSVQVTDQGSSEALPRGRSADRGANSFKAAEQVSHDAGGGDSGRSKAARGQVPRQESAMGRHESFDPTTSVRTSYAPAGAIHSDALSQSGVSVGIRALRDRWRAAHTAACVPGLSEPERDRLGDLATAAEKALIAAPIRMAADLACKVEALREHIGVNDLSFGDPCEVALAVCRGVELLARMPTAAPKRSLEVSDAIEIDPIFEVIDDHLIAFAQANTEPDEALADAALVRHQHVYAALKAITPTTASGICALASHLRRFFKNGGNEIENTFAGEAFTVLLNAVERYEYSSTDPMGDKPMPFDLSRIDSNALDHLFDVYESVHEQWLAVGCQPCSRPDRDEPGST